MHISLSVLSTPGISLNTNLQYLAGHTRWYNRWDTLCALFIGFIMVSISYHGRPTKQASGNLLD